MGARHYPPIFPPSKLRPTLSTNIHLFPRLLMVLVWFDSCSTSIPQLPLPKFISIPLNHAINFSPTFPSKLLPIGPFLLHKHLNLVDEHEFIFKFARPHESEDVAESNVLILGPRNFTVPFHLVEDAV